MANVKSPPERGKLPSLHKRKLTSKDSIDKKLAAMKSITGLLDDLSPQQTETFDKTVKRRPLFNQ